MVHQFILDPLHGDGDLWWRPAHPQTALIFLNKQRQNRPPVSHILVPSDSSCKRSEASVGTHPRHKSLTLSTNIGPNNLIVDLQQAEM